MCGRYSLSKVESLEKRYKIAPIEFNITPRYNIAPTQKVPVIINDGVQKLVMFRWGLIPNWAKDISIGYKMINARAETVDVKPSFKGLFQRRRCLIPADGFFEWKKANKRKTPYRILLKNEEIFSFAGLWDSWVSPQGEIINFFTIITTVANEVLSPIHDRMPVIMNREHEDDWLNNTISNVKILKGLLEPYPSEELIKIYEVSSVVNSPGNDTIECLKPKENV